MKVCVYLEQGGRRHTWSGGITRAYLNHTKALRAIGLDLTADPRDNFDLLHIHSIGPRSLYLAEKFSGRKPMIIHCHTTAEDFANSFIMSDAVAPYLARYLRYYYSKADLLIAPTAYAKSVVHGYEIETPVEVVSNGVDTERVRYSSKKRLLARWKYGLKGLTVFAVGTVLLRKGVDVFCRVAAMFPMIQFVWFGRVHKALKAGTMRIIERAPSNVLFTGHVEDDTEAYAGGDIFLFPSMVENEGIAILEAAAAARPLLLRDAECFAGRFLHGQNCLKAASVQEFAWQLERLAQDEELRTRLGAAAHAYAARHSLDAVGTRLREIYSRLM